MRCGWIVANAKRQTVDLRTFVVSVAKFGLRVYTVHIVSHLCYGRITFILINENDTLYSSVSSATVKSIIL